jgi:hypothetical protein
VEVNPVAGGDGLRGMADAMPVFDNGIIHLQTTKRDFVRGGNGLSGHRTFPAIRLA